MKREHFVKVVEAALDSLPQEFRSRIKNVAILVEDFPPNLIDRAPQNGGHALKLFVCLLARYRSRGNTRHIEPPQMLECLGACCLGQLGAPPHQCGPTADA